MSRSGVLALITARGGSKRLPGKNLAELGGKPLIVWTIEAAISSGALDRLIVSTDDPAIAEAARAAGAEVPFIRPANLSKDTTPHLPVVQHALAWVVEHGGLDPEYVVLLQPTSPLRAGEDITAAVNIAKSKSAEAVISVRHMHGHPSWLLRLSDDGALLPWQDHGDPSRRETSAYIPNGAIYVVRAETIRSGGSWYGANTWPYIMPQERSIDIDQAWDLHLARLIVADCLGPEEIAEGIEPMRP